jgi:Peptidase family M1 domain
MRHLLLCSLLIAVASVAAADNAQLFALMQNALQAKDENAYLRLVSSKPDAQSEEKEFVEEFLSFGYQRAVFQMLDDQPSQILIQVFVESAEQARLECWAVTTVLESSQQVISGHRRVSSLTGLYRLRLDNAAIHVRNLDIKHFDAIFHLKEGKIFLLKAAGTVTGLVFIGDSTFEFSPPISTEKQQLTLFCKQPRLLTAVPSFYIRTSADNLQNLFGKALQIPGVVDEQLYSRAQEIATAGNLEAYNVNIPMTNELWFPMVERDHLFCLLKSPYGTLLYQYAASEKDNTMLFRKEKEQIISLYNATGIKGTEGPDDYKILDYRLRLTYQPHGSYFTAVAQMQIESNLSTSSLLFKLSSQLRVTSIRSSQGPLIYFQETNSKSIHLVLNQQLDPGDQLSLIINYQGSLQPEETRVEAQSISHPAIQSEEQERYVTPTFLFSNQAFWYPQPTFKAYLHAAVTVTVPGGYVAVSNGQLKSRQEQQGRETFAFETGAPVKYLTLFIGRLPGLASYKSIVPIQIYYDTIDKKTADEYARVADKILRFYTDYFGPYPYKTLTIVLRPLKEPGGHAPATMVMINRVYTFWQLRFKKDPLYQPDFPMLILAHEIAHQWWGQAVGWKEYQDQWLSEGFAQFAAWEYTRHASGDHDWSRLAETFSDWIEEKTYAGPLVLGARLGHLNEDPRAFSAILYHKGAYLLNMLKNWIGQEAFRAALQDFYKTYQFKFADADAFQDVVQKHSPQSVSNFFQQWLYSWGIPSVRWSDQTETKDSQLYLKLRFNQPQENFYLLRVTVEARAKDGNVFRATVEIQKAQQEVELRVPFEPASVAIDPLHENLMKTQKQ